MIDVKLERPRPALGARREVLVQISTILARLTEARPFTMETLVETSKLSFEFRRQLVDRYIQSSYGLTVQSGPFKGMVYVDEAAGSLLGPKILGTYEIELSRIFFEIHKYKRFVDLGCAEGYFAVGSLLKSSQIQTFAFDIDPSAQKLCRSLAALNKVDNRLSISGLCSPSELATLSGPETLVMIDIEGAEVDFLKNLDASMVLESDLIIETHSHQTENTLEFVYNYFSSTHDVVIIEQQVRDPSAFPQLMLLGQVDRFVAQWEGRGAEPWVFAKARR